MFVGRCLLLFLVAAAALTREAAAWPPIVQQFQAALNDGGGTVRDASLQATETIARALFLPVSGLKADVATTVSYGTACSIATTDPMASPLAATLSAIGKLWGNGLVAAIPDPMVHGTTSSGIAFQVEKALQAAAPAYYNAIAPLASWNGGGGAGFGFSLYCNDAEIFTFGSGGGGGYDQQSQSGSLGGGGGAQTPEFGEETGYDVGGGAGCSVHSTKVSSCLPKGDGSFDTFARLMNEVQQRRSQCAELSLCGGGGGGGGFAVTSGGSTCHFGGSFSFNFTRRLLLRPDGTAAVTALPGKCPPNGPDAVVQSASQQCSTQCAGHGSAFYRTCYCPCFKSAIMDAGLSWGFTMSCTV